MPVTSRTPGLHALEVKNPSKATRCMEVGVGHLAIQPPRHKYLHGPRTASEVLRLVVQCNEVRKQLGVFLKGAVLL